MPDYPKHLPAFSYVGCHRYFLTFCAHARRPLFNDRATVQSALSQLLRTSKDEEIEVIAYCFMPDHVHLVVEGKAAHSDLKRFISRTKQFSGYAYARAHDGARLWQRYGYEHVLRDEEATEKVVAYVLENPVRKGWVEHPAQWPFTGSLVYTLTELIEFAYGKRAG